MSASRILTCWALILVLMPFLTQLVSGPSLGWTLWACWATALLMALCAWATSARVGNLLIRQLAMALAIVATLTLSIIAMRSMLDRARDGAISDRPEITRLVEAHNASLPEGFPSRIEVGTPPGLELGPVAILGLVVCGMLLQQSIQWKGRVEVKTADAATGAD